MRKAIAHLESIAGSPYQQSRHITAKKKSGELDDDFEERIWRERLHCTEEGFVLIPPLHFMRSLHEAASYNPIKIPGQRNRTFTKHIQNGTLVPEGLILPIHKDDVQGTWVSAGSQGAGSNKRVLKCFPTVPKWEGEVAYEVMDDIITEDIFARVLRTAGMFIGIGTYRPSAPSHGVNGRYLLKDITWHEYEI